jgi:hypothetical protein
LALVGRFLIVGDSADAGRLLPHRNIVNRGARRGCAAIDRRCFLHANLTRSAEIDSDYLRCRISWSDDQSEDRPGAARPRDPFSDAGHERPEKRNDADNRDPIASM